jgi:hypothetical protein
MILLHATALLLVWPSLQSATPSNALLVLEAAQQHRHASSQVLGFTWPHACRGCRDYVKKVALYQGKLAVQLPSRIVIYELADNDTQDTDAGGMQVSYVHRQVIEESSCTACIANMQAW